MSALFLFPARILLTNGILYAETIQLGLSQATPHLWLSKLVGIVQSTVDADNLVHKDINSQGMLIVFLVDSKGLFIQAVLGGDPGNFAVVIRVEFLDISDNFTTVGEDSSKEEKILKVLVLVEWRRFENDLLQEFNQLSWEVCCSESLDGHGNIIGVSALGNGSANNLEYA